MSDEETARIRRGFADVKSGQIHYRQAGSGPVLLLLHASPGSSKQLEPLINALAANFLVIAPDTPGNGDSTPLPHDAPAIVDYTRVILEFMEVREIANAHVYGTHTGACLASELALMAPEKVNKLVQDGVVVFSDEERADYIANYAAPFKPDLEGTQFLKAFLFCRDQFMFFPWYARDKQHRRDSGLPDPNSLHDWVVEVLKAGTSYHLAYRAAFAYPADERLPQVPQPILCVAAADDPLRAHTADIVDELPQGQYRQLPRFDDPDYIPTLAATMTAFLQS